MSDDIVKRLRLTPVLMKYDEMGYPRTDYEACKKFVNDEGVKLMREAADEIERLRNERDGYSAGNQQTLRALAEANAIAQQYKRERDEARWRLCKVVGDNRGVWGNDIAAEYGWFYLVEATDAE